MSFFGGESVSRMRGGRLPTASLFRRYAPYEDVAPYGFGARTECLSRIRVVSQMPLKDGDFPQTTRLLLFLFCKSFWEGVRGSPFGKRAPPPKNSPNRKGLSLFSLVRVATALFGYYCAATGSAASSSCSSKEERSIFGLRERRISLVSSRSNSVFRGRISISSPISLAI